MDKNIKNHVVLKGFLKVNAWNITAQIDRANIYNMAFEIKTRIVFLSYMGIVMVATQKEIAVAENTQAMTGTGSSLKTVVSRATAITLMDQVSLTTSVSTLPIAAPTGPSHRQNVILKSADNVRHAALFLTANDPLLIDGRA